MTARVGRGPQVVLLLSHAQGRDQFWLSPGDAVLVLRGGRLVRTAGFDQNLLGTRFPDGHDPVAEGLHGPNRPATYLRLVDLEEPQLFGTPLESTFTTLGPRKITIVELEFDTLLVREDSHAQRLNWDFTNYYWVDPVDGFVWKSRQHFARGLPALDYEVLKPAG